MNVPRLVAGLLLASPMAMAADVGISISIGQPGFYGRIDIGDFPPPLIVYERPIIIERGPRYIEREPIYLRVPLGHARHWSKYCYRYHACDRQVYFVRDDWYLNDYAPRYRERYGDDHARHDHGRDGRRDDDERGSRGDRHDDRQGEGHDRYQHGHGKG
ncbi:hypothetical protein ABWL39_19150 [Chitinivorax sp. PXF-14]|uniref:hypothetical protein n=1 Tax=Chitinivorax sp. PXF-14 TaxID=3230488 RepID=UPI003465D51D